MNVTKLSSLPYRVSKTLSCRYIYEQNYKRPKDKQKVEAKQKPESLDGKINIKFDTFDEMHEHWWSKDNLLHAFNHVRVPFIRHGIMAAGVSKVTDGGNTHRLNGVKILDVGCGGGILSEALARIGADVTAIDINKGMIDVAKAHQQGDPAIRNNLRYHHTSIYEHEKKNVEKYNAVVVSEVIEHVHAKEKFLNSCYNTVQPGGSLFVTCPNKTLLSKIFGVKLAEAFKIVPKGTHDFDNFINPEDLTKILKKLNCAIRSAQGIIYNPFTGRFSMVSPKTFMYAVHAQKIRDTILIK